MQTANSWTRDKAVGNNFLANGGTELNTTTALYDLEYRTYDPALGRMYQVDPMSGKYSSLTTYNYAFNNPVSFNDPNGADPEEAAQFKAQKALGSPSGVSNSFDNLYRGNIMFSMFDTGWRPGIGSMAATISQWNPDFGGPMYLGQGYNGAIYGLPTEIEAAGGADEFIESKGGLDPTYGYNEKSLNRMRMEYNRTVRAPGSSFEDWLAERQSQEGDPGKGWFTKLGELFEKNYNGGVTYDRIAWYGTNFIGPGPDKNPYMLPDPKAPEKILMPKDMVDAAAQRHDYYYFILKASGLTGALFNLRVTFADQILANEALKAYNGFNKGEIDPVTCNPISPRTRDMALDILITFGLISGLKSKF